MDVTVVDAVEQDAPAIALLHAASWRQAYRGILPDRFLDHEVVEHRRRMWTSRMATSDASMVVLKARVGDALCGFACVFLDAHPVWGALLDNLHVEPDLTGQGVGAELLAACRERVRVTRPGSPLHLFVFEENKRARIFYERHDGLAEDRTIVEVLPGVRVPEVRYSWNPA